MNPNRVTKQRSSNSSARDKPTLMRARCNCSIRFLTVLGVTGLIGHSPRCGCSARLRLALCDCYRVVWSSACYPRGSCGSVGTGTGAGR
ncbi:MAG: hypothetical protein [Caudoviricetes sp.]|nr:MAG: hypothetical protein [Caudoviricetes sp.]